MARGRRESPSWWACLRVASLPAAVLAGALTLSALPAAAQEREPVLVEFWVGRLASATAPAWRVGDHALIPVAFLLELAEVRVAVAADGALTATLQPSRRQLVMDPHDDTLRVGGVRVPVQPHEVLFHDGEVFLSAHHVERLLGTRVSVNWSDLAVTIQDPSALPIAQRHERLAARSAYLSLATGLPGDPDAAIALERPGFDGVVVDYALAAPSARPAEGFAAFVAVGANVFGGALEATHSRSGGAGTPPRTTGSWLGVWPGEESRWVRQLRVGDGGSTGPRSRAIQGIALSNSPYVRSAMFGALRYPGSVEPGWEVEVYRDGRLVAFDSADAGGRFGVDLPVMYGQNPAEIRAYGPHGELRVMQQHLHIRDERVPGGVFEYGASFGACRSTGCAQAANVDARYGVSSRWTLRAGADEFWRREGHTLHHPYAGVAGSLTNALALRLDAVAHAFTRLETRYEPNSGVRLTLEGAHFARGVAQPVLSPAGWRSLVGAGAIVRPFGAWKSLLTADVQHISMQAGSLTRGRVGGVLGVAGAQLHPYVRGERSDAGAPGTTVHRRWVGALAYVAPHPSLGRRISRLWMRAAAEAEGGERLTSASVFVAHPLPGGMRVEAGAAWQRGDAPRVALTLSTDLRQLRALTSAVGQRGEWSALQSVNGSVLWNGSSRELSFVAGPSLQRAGVTGRVFMDVNGNGLFDDGDEPLAGVTVRVGGAGAVTDEHGFFQAWNVTPYIALPVQVETGSLASPLWVPSQRLVSVVPGANRFATVQIPIVSGGVVEGTVFRDGAAAAGVRVVLTHEGTGERHLATTFSDGEFILLGVPPGRYVLDVDALVQQRLRSRAEPVSVEVRAVPDGDTVAAALHLRALDP